ncbi:MAG: zinc ribbon domain-containing protein [Bacilli bacterium]|nr:zinc ribbon domain-containing protein [Bacilli bacterium]
MALINCPECGKEVSDSAKNCIHCGYKLNDSSDNIEKIKDITNDITKKYGKKKLIYIGAIIIIVIIAIIALVGSKKAEDEENSKAIRVDITMNSWYGSIEEILDDFDLEFYAVTSGANCFSGVKTNQFETEKYGILYTEFTYCKSNDIQRFRLYNKAADQPLRDPEPGEINSYSSLGSRESNSSL